MNPRLALAMVALLGVLPDSLAHPQNRRISADLGPGGNVFGFQVSPDGTRFVYRAVGAQHEFHLGSLDDPTPPEAFVGGEWAPQGLAFTPDGATIVYSEHPDSPQSGVYAMPSDRSSAARRLGPGYLFDLAPDGQRVVFLEGSGGRLFSAEVSGESPPVLLSGGIANANFPRVSPTSTHVAFSDATGLSKASPYGLPLYTVRIDGSAPPILIDTPQADDASLFVGVISGDGRHVTYRRNDGPQTPFTVFSAPIERDSPPVRLSPRVLGTVAAVSPRGDRWVYNSEEGTPGHLNLFSLPIAGIPAASAGPEPILLSGSLFAGVGSPQPYGVDDVVIDPRGEKVAFALRGAAGDSLHATPIDRREEPVLLSSGALDVGAFAFVPDGSRVVFSAAFSDPEVYELFSVAVDGSRPAVRLNDDFVPGGSLQRRFSLRVPFAIAPDGSRVVYAADQELDERYELFVVPVAGGASSVKVNGPLVDGGIIFADTDLARGISFTPDGGTVLYTATQDTLGVVELYATTLSSRPLSATGIRQRGNRR